MEDALQGQGVGTRLLERLADIAREHGISIFEAEVLGHNRRMIDVFHHCGFDTTQRRIEGDVEKVVLAITPTDAYAQRAAERSERAAAASMKLLFEPRSSRFIGASASAEKSALKSLQPDSNGFMEESCPSTECSRSWGSSASPGGSARRSRSAVITVPAEKVGSCGTTASPKGQGDHRDHGRLSEMRERAGGGEAALVEKIRAAGIRMVGPNCMGLVNTDPDVRLDASFGPIYPPAGRVALSSQSGALGLALLDYAAKLNLGISTFVSVGNKADVSGNDLIQYWSEDPRTKVILLYLESFGNPVHFSRIARRVARTKPIVAVKSGRSAGLRAAAPRTRSAGRVRPG